MTAVLLRSESGHIIGGAIHDAGKFGAGHERQGVLGLVEALYLQAIHEADRGSAYLHADLAGADLRRRHLPDGDAVD